MGERAAATVMVVVLDLNGVLVDVRRYEEQAVTRRAPDIVLPNRQKAYLNPCAKEFIDWLTGASVDVVLYTSRTKNNAAPIERAISDMCPCFKPALMLHQEECDGTSGWRPTKTVEAVLAGLRRPELKAEDVVFVDDHPNSIKLGGASAVRVRRYDALRMTPEDAREDLRSAMWSLYDTFKKKV